MGKTTQRRGKTSPGKENVIKEEYGVGGRKNKKRGKKKGSEKKKKGG